MGKKIKTFESFIKSFNEEAKEDVATAWTLTVYDEDDNVRHQEDIEADNEIKAETVARKKVDTLEDYRDGWDWTLMPKEFWN